MPLSCDEQRSNISKPSSLFLRGMLTECSISLVRIKDTRGNRRVKTNDSLDAFWSWFASVLDAATGELEPCCVSKWICSTSAVARPPRV